MGIVVEVVGRNGTIIRSQSFDGDTVTIGRAFDCDVILNDVHVDALHLTVKQDENTQGLVCQDTNTLNGSWLIEPARLDGLHRKKHRILNATPVFSGQAFLLGRTYLRIYAKGHWVAPTQPLSSWEDFGHFLGHYWLAALLCVMVIAIEMWAAYLDAPQSKKVFQYALSGIYPILAVSIYALIWAVVGKTSKHDGKYITQMSIGLLTLFALLLIKLFLPSAAYGLGLGVWEVSIYKILIVLLGYACLSATLIFASNLKPLSRHILSILIPLVFLIPFFIELLTSPDFQERPNYDRSLASPFWSWQTPVDTEEFLELAKKVYSENDINAE